MSDADDFRADMRELADDIRGIPNNEFGLNENSCALVRKGSTGENPGDGKEIIEIIPLTCNGANPKIKFPNQRDVALGLMSLGEIFIGPLTPKFRNGPNGGVQRSLFDGEGLEPGDRQFIRVTGPDGSFDDYMVNYTNTDSALRVMIKCTNVKMGGT